MELAQVNLGWAGIVGDGQGRNILEGTLEPARYIRLFGAITEIAEFLAPRTYTDNRISAAYSFCSS